MPAASYDFVIEQGATLVKPIIWSDSNGAPINLTGYSAKMQLRQSVNSDDVLLELSSASNTLVITPATGTITMVFSATTTAAITWSRAKYDLEVTSETGAVTRLIEGLITVSKEVTR
jgi:hypothetical protein